VPVNVIPLPAVYETILFAVAILTQFGEPDVPEL
jgi:hypothetical protein